MPEDPFPQFELVPADGDDLGVDAELEGFVDPDAPGEIEVPDQDGHLPLGRSLSFDSVTGRFGSWCSGVDSVVTAAALALRVERGAWMIFPPEAGMDDPDGLIGYVDTAERVAIYESDVTNTLLHCHERLTDVTDFQYIHDVNDDVAYVNVTVEIDSTEEVTIERVPVLS